VKYARRALSFLESRMEVEEPSSTQLADRRTKLSNLWQRFTYNFRLASESLALVGGVLRFSIQVIAAGYVVLWKRQTIDVVLPLNLPSRPSSSTRRINIRSVKD